MKQLMHNRIFILILTAALTVTFLPSAAFADALPENGVSSTAQASGETQPAVKAETETASSGETEAAEPAAGAAEPSETADTTQKNSRAAGKKTAGESAGTGSAGAAEDNASSPSENSENTEHAQTNESPAKVDFLSDGTYQPDRFTFSGGTGKVKITCPEVTLRDGYATAKIVFSSRYYTKMRVNGTEYDPEYTSEGAVFRNIPVNVNTEYTVSGLTTAMSEPHWVEYQLHITLSKDSKAASEEKKPSNGNQKTPSSHENSGSSKKLKNGTWRVRTSTDDYMFHILAAKDGGKYSIVHISKHGTTAEITLTGTGYDYLFMGTVKQAKQQKKANLSKFRKTKSGYYTYRLAISKLDKPLKIAAHAVKSGKWFQHTITFFTKGAKKVKNGTSASSLSGGKGSGGSSGPSDSGRTHGTQTTFTNDHRAAKVSKYHDDSSSSTAAVDSSTSLKDGVYAPESFSWSGGSGRLSGITCQKITVRGGKAYASIVFGSSKYDQLRANGKVYYKSGGGNSTFVIPVRLNSNNTIIGRTTAMSSPHWIRYTIYVGKAIPKAKQKALQKKIRKQNQENRVKFAKKAPEIEGLTYRSKEKVKKAKYFRIFRYNHGVSLIQVKLTKDTGLDAVYRKNQSEDTEEEFTYDDEGQKVGKTAPEITEALYHHRVVNYLIVPEKYELAAGLEKNYIIIRKPAKHTYTTSKRLKQVLKQVDRKQYAGRLSETDETPDYRKLLTRKTDLAVLGAGVLPAKKADEDTVEEKQEDLEKLESRFAALDIPVLVDRSGQEKSKYAKAEWLLVWSTIYGNQKEAKDILSEMKAK